MPSSRTRAITPLDVVNNTSNQVILQALKKLKKHQFSKQRLLGPKNIYKSDTINKTNDESRTINVDHLSEYIAASTFTHCFDGWNYLTRGVESLINGDIPSCIHFVYYSELRAVMSLMACEGIGIFDRRHFYYDTGNIPNPFKNGGTHKIAKDLIEEWSKLNSRKHLIFQYIKINGTNLEALINSTGISTNSAYVSSILGDWFTTWSLDLRLNADQILRNETTYRPHFHYTSVNSSKTINSISRIWSGLEPTTSIKFLELDRHLVRLTFERLFIITTGKKVKSVSFQKFVKRALDSTGESSNASLFDFLVRKTDKEDHFILKESRKARLNNNIISIDPIPMICRSVLLLRMASGSVNNTFERCYIESQDLRFWWEKLAFGFGITNSESPGIETSDLFTDVREAINNFQSDLNDHSCTKDNLGSYSDDLNTIKQFQRICFWGIGL